MCPDGSTGTGCIGKKNKEDGKLYLVTCWHTCSDDVADSKPIQDVAQGSNFRFFHYNEEAESLCLEGSTLLENEEPVGNEVCMPNMKIRICINHNCM